MVRYGDDAGQAFVLSKDAEQRSKVLSESAQGAEDSSQQLVQLPFHGVWLESRDKRHSYSELLQLLLSGRIGVSRVRISMLNTLSLPVAVWHLIDCMVCIAVHIAGLGAGQCDMSCCVSCMSFALHLSPTSCCMEASCAGR